MTYEEIVEKVRAVYEYADARDIFEHIAVQVNVTGEGEGIFYIEIANRQICVEPYDYFDRDILVIADGKLIADIAEGKVSYQDAYTNGKFDIYGNADKIAKLSSIRIKKAPAKKTPAKKNTAKAGK